MNNSASLSTYFHLLEGRLRIKVPLIKRSPVKAAELEQLLRRMNGVAEVMANPITGNVLIFFDEEVINHQDILRKIARTGLFGNGCQTACLCTTRPINPSIRTLATSTLAASTFGKEALNLIALQCLQTATHVVAERFLLALL